MRAVGQTYASMGAADPRMNQHGKLDFRLTSLYKAWSKADEPPSRVKPLPLGLLRNMVHLSYLEATAASLAASECLVCGYYFLLRPGEYMCIRDDVKDNMFRLKDLSFWIGARALDVLHCPVADLQAATFVTLTLTRQKNGVRNKTIGHGRSGHPTLCSVLSLVARTIALRHLQAPPLTPLNAYAATSGRPLRYIQPTDITRRLQHALSLYPDPAITPSEISARSTRAGGAMALLCAGVDRDRIRLVDRWRSDELFRYLHVQAQPVMTGLSAAMLAGGSFQLAPGQSHPPSSPLALGHHPSNSYGVNLCTGVGGGTVPSRDIVTNHYSSTSLHHSSIT